MKRNAVAWAALIVSTAALLSSLSTRRPLPAAPQVTPESQKVASGLTDAFERVAEYVKPSVVQINVLRKDGGPNPRNGRRLPFPGGPNGPHGMEPKDFEEMLKKFFGPDVRPEKEQFGGPRAEGTGSGFVYDDKGHILTNNHVVESAAKITVTFHDGTEVAAKVVGTDPGSDVAVIKVENTTFPPMHRGQSSKLKVGEMVMAVGSPYGLSQSVTTGIISATERNNVRINEFESFLQTDAAINPGNSGGPLVNMLGQVIGINSAIVTGGRGNDGVGFAIPIDMASTVTDSLIQFGKVQRSRVGIALEPLSPVFAKQVGLDPNLKGVVVGDIVPNSPAAKAGLQRGDVITGFNGGPVVGVPSFRLTVSSSAAGKEFSLKYWREGKEHTTTIVPAPYDKVVFAQEKEAKEETPEAGKPVEKATIGNFGLEVQPLTAELAAHFGHAKDAKGLLISGVKPGSPAEAAGLEPGELITRVVKDRKVQTLTSVKDFESLTSKADELALYVESHDRPGRFVTITKANKD
jgi:serine protease Do